MARPSRNVDQQLLKSGRELLPVTGIRALSIRQVAEHAGVNLGMFHYHFKSKDVFVRTLLDGLYDDMFASLELESHRSPAAMENLRAAVNVLARFARDHRALLVRLMNDAFGGEVVAREFLQANMPRHITVISTLLMQSQKEGAIGAMPIPQALAFLIGGVAAPIVMVGAAIANEFMPPPMVREIEVNIFSDAAIAQRVDMALSGLASVKSVSSPSAVTTRSKKGIKK